VAINGCQVHSLVQQFHQRVAPPMVNFILLNSALCNRWEEFLFQSAGVELDVSLRKSRSAMSGRS